MRMGEFQADLETSIVRDGKQIILLQKAAKPEDGK